MRKEKINKEIILWVVCEFFVLMPMNSSQQHLLGQCVSGCCLGVNPDDALTKFGNTVAIFKQAYCIFILQHPHSRTPFLCCGNPRTWPSCFCCHYKVLFLSKICRIFSKIVPLVLIMIHNNAFI